MSYSPSIPASTDLLSTSQGDIQTNFSQANTIFAVNHVTFNDATVANRGKHKHVVMTNQADPTTALSEISLYSKASVLYLKKENNGTVIQMSGVDPSVGASGQTFLPGGIVMKWGLAGKKILTTATEVVFPTTFNAACFCVILTAADPNARYFTITSKAKNKFSARADKEAADVYYIAIGN